MQVGLSRFIVVLGEQSLSLGRPGASTLASLGPLGHLGTPVGQWEQKEGHVGIRNQNFCDFVRILARAF